MLDILKNKAVWAGLVAGGAAISVLLGRPALGAVFSDPTLADKLTLVVTTIASIFAAFLAPPAAK